MTHRLVSAGARRCQAAPGVQRERLIAASEDIDAHVIGSRVVMRADPGRDRLLVAVRDQRVHQPVARLAVQVVVGEAEAAEIAHVVGQGEIVVDEGPGPLAADPRVGAEHHRLLRGEQDTGAERLAGCGRMLGRDQVRMRRGRPHPRQG